ncbi:phenylacetate--CoA ligase family protein [Marinobacter alkaliphilus]|uniref:phenylacetate--CoA ligase family protein n=1 Tax=Marinobacter alkaliphilus TaxID=254719 RepID=UPI003D8113BA|nr:hypothetical protein PBN92_09205 [Marinobacter alkaliphilus]
MEKLNRLISHARETVPYYRNLPAGELRSLEELKNIPLLEKEVLRENADQLRSSRQGLRPRRKTTGGSTGAAVTLHKSAEGMAKELAATWRGYSWAGIDIGDKQARFWGIPHDKKDRLRAHLIDLVTNRLRFSAFAFSESDFENYISKLEEFNPKYFYGYVSMIRQLAEYIENNNIVFNFRPSAIITTAEVLTQPDRKKIESVFKCKVYNEYGCGEIGTIAHECSSGSLHLTSENIILEIVDESGNSVPPGKQGEIVVTDLVNYSMPLIRYKIKDYGEIAIKSCACGVRLPCLENIYGREYDYLVNSRGEKFHGEFFLYMVENITKTGISFRGVQFVQSPDLSIVVRLVGDDLDKKALSNYFIKNIVEKMNDNVDISVDFVEEIQRESSGKLRVVKRLTDYM